MDPRWLFPVLSALFAALALWRLLGQRRRSPQSRSYLLLAVAFGAVSLWLHLAP